MFISPENKTFSVMYVGVKQHEFDSREEIKQISIISVNLGTIFMRNFWLLGHYCLPPPYEAKWKAW